MKNKNLEERVKNGYLYKKEPIKLYLKEVCMRCCFFDGYMCCKRRDVFPELKHSVCILLSILELSGTILSHHLLYYMP